MEKKSSSFHPLINLDSLWSCSCFCKRVQLPLLQRRNGPYKLASWLTSTPLSQSTVSLPSHRAYVMKYSKVTPFKPWSVFCLRKPWICQVHKPASRKEENVLWSNGTDRLETANTRPDNGRWVRKALALKDALSRTTIMLPAIRVGGRVSSYRGTRPPSRARKKTQSSFNHRPQEISDLSTEPMSTNKQTSGRLWACECVCLTDKVREERSNLVHTHTKLKNK